jgi:hypothetical protein
LITRIDANRCDVRQARSDAARRAGATRDPTRVAAPDTAERTGPVRERPSRERPVIAGAVAGLVVAGVVAGVLADSSRRSPAPPTIADYMAGHVPSGTSVAVMGAVRTAVPRSYPAVAVSGSDPAAAGALPYALTPDPVSGAGPLVASYVRAHGRLVAVDHGKADLWQLGPPARPPATTVAPATTRPPLSSSTVPAGRSRAGAPPARPRSRPGTLVVQPGQSLWSIAAGEVQQRLEAPPPGGPVGQYWAQLVAANHSRLPVPGDPDLIYPGTVIALPEAG